MQDKINAQIQEFGVMYHKLLKLKTKYNVCDTFPELTKLNENEIAVIRIISEGNDVIVKDILDELEIPKSTLTSIINRLEEKSMVERCISKKDKRTYNLKLTDKGQKVQIEHVKFEETVYGFILKALDTEKERDTLLKLFTKIINNLSK